MDFEEHQKQVYELSSFISEQEKWLECVLGKLQWTKEYLSSANASLEQCPYNVHHYVPSSSLESHKAKCWYSSQGVKMNSETAQSLASTNAFYSQSDIPHAHIDHSTEGAILRLAAQLEAEQSLPQSTAAQLDTSSSHITNKPSDSLENAKGTPPELLTRPPNQIISYIKSWLKVPSDFVSLPPSTLNRTQIKGWLFQNLPDKHIHSSALGGEIVTVETIMNWLSSDSSDVPCLTPDALVDKLNPMLGSKSRSFVLDLWKYIHISRLQSEHGMQDSVVEDIVPLTAAAQLNRPEDDEEEAPSISERIKELLLKSGSEEEAGGTEETSHPLPIDHVFYKFTTSERRTLYEYAVEVTSRLGSSSKVKELDLDLYRDDAAALKAKLKAEKQLSASGEDQGGGRKFLVQLKRKRDYRRRRQAYRAKNVHITRRTPKEIHRDIINNRMKEIAAAAPEILAQDSEATNDIHEDSVTANTIDEAGTCRGGIVRERQEWEEEQSRSPKPEGSKVGKALHNEEEEYYGERSRSYKRKKHHHHRSRSQSRSGSRSRSKQRRHKKHKKQRSRSRSHSVERSRHRRKHKRHSRSKSPTN